MRGRPASPPQRVDLSFSRKSRCVVFLAFALSSACRSDAGDSHPNAVYDESSKLHLAGEFQDGMKPTQGRAEIVARGRVFELRLHQVQVKSNRPVRVYLVGAERASTTRKVVEAELKYDMAELDPSVTQQVIALPGQPDPVLRSVVLWDPVFGVNLGFAPLLPVD